MPDLTVCPGCGGEADNGFDRCFPPNPYYCKKCHDIEALQSDLRTLAECVVALVEVVESYKEDYCNAVGLSDSTHELEIEHAPAITLAQGILEGGE